MAKPTKLTPKAPNQWNPEAPYNELPLLPTEDLEPKAILNRSITARSAVAELKQAAGREKLFLHPKLLTLLTRDGNTVTNY